MTVTFQYNNEVQRIAFGGDKVSVNYVTGMVSDDGNAFK